MVLAVTSSIMKMAAAAISCVIRLMLPICLAQPATKFFSLSVLVSVGELANISSIFFATTAACSGSLTLITYQPTWLPYAVLRSASFRSFQWKNICVLSVPLIGES